MCTGRDLAARVSRARLPYAENLVSGAGLAYKGPGVIGVRAGIQGERVGSWSSWCLPAVRGRACVGAWAGGASGDSFGAFTPVVVWDIA